MEYIVSIINHGLKTPALLLYIYWTIWRNLTSTLPSSSVLFLSTNCNFSFYSRIQRILTSYSGMRLLTSRYQSIFFLRSSFSLITSLQFPSNLTISSFFNLSKPFNRSSSCEAKISLFSYTPVRFSMSIFVSYSLLNSYCFNFKF